MMRIDDLPGELMMWVLIGSEVLVFGAGISAMSVVRLTDPSGFAAAQTHLDGRLAALNTVLLITSGLLAALAERAAAQKDARARSFLILAALGGLVFLGIKIAEYGVHMQEGIGIDSGSFWTFYYLLTGFHAAHVLAGAVVLGLVGWRIRGPEIQAGVMFWHMVDLVWVLILPPVYLLG